MCFQFESSLLFLLHQVMTSSSVPSTLVKCLYLFFDLPPLDEADEDSTKTESEFSPKERRILLQKMFIQVNKAVLTVITLFPFYRSPPRSSVFF